MSQRTSWFSKIVLDERILALPIGHLQLSESVRLTLKERETIGGLITAVETRRPNWSRSVRSEIYRVLRVLTRCMRHGTVEGWERFRTCRPKAADATAIYFTSFSLDRLQSSVRSLLVGTLHVRTRAASALARAKIQTIDDLINAAISGIVRPRPGGAGTCLEIIEILEALSQSVLPSGGCDWIKYAKCRGILLLPQRASCRFVAGDYVKRFPEVIQESVLVDFGQRGVILLRDNVLCVKKRRKSSKMIGKQLSIARQNIDVLRIRILRRLRDALLKDDYTGCSFRFRPEFVAPLRALAAELSKVRDRAIGYSEWNELVSNCLLTTTNRLAQMQSGLLEILGFQLVTFTQTRFRPLVLPYTREAAPLRRALLKAEQLLTTDLAAGFTKTELFGALKRLNSCGQLGKGDMRAVIESLPGVRRRRGTGYYECPLRDVRYLGDQLQRALRDRGQPEHFRELASMIRDLRRAAGTDNQRSIALALSADERFKPIGRSGFWALAEWNVETRTIADLANVFLTQHNRAATEAEFFEFISPRRNVARQSIGTLLKKDDRFMRVAPRTWALRRPVHSTNLHRPTSKDPPNH